MRLPWPRGDALARGHPVPYASQGVSYRLMSMRQAQAPAIRRGSAAWDILAVLLIVLAVAMIGLFAIGVILCLLDMLPLGIGCISVATIAGVTLAAINWGTIGPLLEQHVNEILATALAFAPVAAEVADLNGHAAKIAVAKA